jgi:hypothetical protein
MRGDIFAQLLNPGIIESPQHIIGSDDTPRLLRDYFDCLLLTKLTYRHSPNRLELIGLSRGGYLGNTSFAVLTKDS